MAPILDSSVSELYRNYKSSTNVFLQWLWCQVKLEDPSTKKFTSTKDILAAAKVIKKARSVVPKSILSSLRTAITKRKQVYDIYEKNGAGDHGHAAFCQRLESTLSILSSLTTASAISLSSHVNESEKSVPTPNAFAPLAATVEDVEDDVSEMDILDHACHSNSDCEAPSFAPTAPDDPEESEESDFVLADDAIRQYHDSANFLLVRSLPSILLSLTPTDLAPRNSPRSTPSSKATGATPPTALSPSPWPHGSPPSPRTIREVHLAGTLPEYMEKAKTKVLPELEGNAPISRLNFFGLFLFCARFMRKFGELSEAELGKPFRAAGSPRELWAHPLHLARFATELVLDSIDEGFGSREDRRKLKKKPLVENAGQAFKELNAEATLSQFTWTI
ncbi:hypothetical protein CcaCcLH18_06966 [Colletotrichum camelliae]|nr:hypothetical protein CcaCcLH18_06966 [Colletotrichum camelliae]